MASNTLTWRVGQLEKKVCGVDKKMDELMANHLPHMQRDIESLKVRINVLTVVNVSAIILGLLFAKYL